MGKQCSVGYSHTSYHNSGNTNFDVIGKSGEMSSNNIYSENMKASFTSSDGNVIEIK